jgi:hypothetical protein
MLPMSSPKRKPCLRGVAEDGSVVFVTTEDGVFTVGLGPSLMARKVSEIVNICRSHHVSLHELLHGVTAGTASLTYR